MNRQLLLIRYGEIGLKGKNRRYFINRLLANLRRALPPEAGARVLQIAGRILVECAAADAGELARRLQYVFGISSLSPVFQVAPDLAAIREKALQVYAGLYSEGRTFKVEAKRIDKTFPHQSPQISSLVGEYIIANSEQSRVDLHAPDITINIEVRPGTAFVYAAKIEGPGGLPVGVTGKAVLLLSGGIDSPVAGWMGMKRGLTIEPLHFYSFPFTGEKSKQKVIDLCGVLSRYGSCDRLHIAPFTEVQTAIRRHCPAEYGVIIMRRMMMRIAARLAGQRHAPVLLTGESLGQVASQTLESMVTIEAAAGRPVLRPLIAMDKQEIIACARKIETYAISTRPFEDCCSLFVPRHPVTRPTREQVESMERGLEIDSITGRCLEQIETLTINT